MGAILCEPREVQLREPCILLGGGSTRLTHARVDPRDLVAHFLKGEFAQETLLGLGSRKQPIGCKDNFHRSREGRCLGHTGVLNIERTYRVGRVAVPRFCCTYAGY